LLAAAGAATSLVLLGANWLFQTVTFDELIWLSCLWITARLLRTGDPRLWLGLGAAIGIGMETKYTIIGLILGLIVGTVTTRLRAHLKGPWPWLGGVVAFLIFLPNLVWQISNDWPSLQFTFNHKSAQSLDFSPLTFLVQQLALIGPLAIPLWLAGAYWLLIAPSRRMLGMAAVVTFLVYLFTGKSYYVGPLHPFLIACGACALEAWTMRRWGWLRPAAAAALAVQALVFLPLALPVLPEAQMARSPLAQARTDFAATIGWHDLVSQVAGVYDGLPPAEQSSAVIIANNYGEAGAINTYGGAAGLPAAYSGELSYYYWKPRSIAGPVVTIGFDPGFLRTLFGACDQVATISNSYGLHNEEYGLPISVCREPKFTLDDLWGRLKEFR
jgi:4-amino-4-deoxy-L-arabinose transferase-like glycosyltransferase